jgi:isopentenyl diphosphate isomerase/L-lactate dehydrogenase-like FMN-dependent dehydrogenase/biotin carboxylase
MENLKGKVVAIIGGGLLQLPVITAAKNSGVEAVVVDMNPKAAGVKEADYFINSSTQDAENTSFLLEKFNLETKKINGVLTVGTDASYTVAVCAKKLGLPGIEPEAALAASDKFLMRKALRQAKVAVPDFEMVDTYPKAIEILERFGSDCVIKPTRNMGARGVRRVFNLEDLKEGFELALHYADNGKVIVEQYIDAPELSIDALIYDDKIFITGIADRIIEYDPFFVETGHIMPSRLSEDLINYAVDTFKKGIKALGISIGAAKGDIKVSSSGCYIGEIAARLSGGFMSTYTYPYSSGVDLMTNMVRISMGFSPLDLEPKQNWVSIERSIIAAPGMIKEIKGIEEAKKIKQVKNIFFDSRVGDKIKAPLNNLDKSGHIIVAAPTFQEALKASHQAMRAIHIKTVEDDDQLIPENTVNEKARLKFNGRCFVCPDCDGIKCRGMMPGVGGIATGNGFVNAINQIRKIDLVPSYINTTKFVNTETDFFGIPIQFPILPGPLTGSITNLGGAISEIDLARAIVKGANHAGTIGFVGDGATPTKYRIGLRVVMENFGLAVPIFKPRYDNKLILERIEGAKEAGAIAVGIDIDGASFLTMEMKGQSTSTKTFEELKELVDCAGIPFILKGILSPRDADTALKAGVKALIVSNHGGRVNDALAAPIDALKAVKKAVGNDALIILDGGVRSGSDVVKCLGMGADLVMIGRPAMIAAVGAGIQGVRQYFNKINNELKKAMAFLGVDNIKDLKNNDIFFYYR